MIINIDDYRKAGLIASVHILPPQVQALLDQGVKELVQRMNNVGFSDVYSTSMRKGAEIHFSLDDLEEGWIRVWKYRNNRTIIDFSYVKSRELIDFIVEVVKIKEALHGNSGKAEVVIYKDETRERLVKSRIISGRRKTLSARDGF